MEVIGITAKTLLRFSLAGKADQVTCAVCNESEIIPNEYLGASIIRTERNEKMSLVLGRAERRKWVKEFYKIHLQKCLGIKK